MIRYFLLQVFPDAKHLPIWIPIAEILVILLIGYILLKVVRRIGKKLLVKSPLDDSVYVLMMRVISIVWWIIIVLIIISYLRVNIVPIISAIGAGGAIIAIAMRDSLGNMAGGVILLFTKPFMAGDEIEINGTVGVVDHIDLLTTQLHTYDNKVIIIPNGTVTTSVVINATRRELRRVNAEFAITENDDIDTARELIFKVVKSEKIFLDEPEPKILLKQAADYGNLLDVGVWCKTEDRFDAAELLKTRVIKEFSQAKIHMAHTHMDIRLADDIKAMKK
ncbi:MAG: mechanosensitive ion channel [Hornefia sp.]|nr:mechanosensitive ion channel [Hornefia sp.]